MSDDHLYGLDGAEEMEADVQTVAERAWEDGYDSPIEVEEWTSKPIRQFINSSNVIDHIIEYDCEDYLDMHGRVADYLEERAKEPAVIAAFDDALDILFKGCGWSWADRRVALWTVTWEGDDEDKGPPTFTYERNEIKK